MKKVIGMIGGLSYESTVDYYVRINQRFVSELGGHNTPEIIIVNVNFEQTIQAANEKKWSVITHMFVCAAKKLEKAGADFIVIPCNGLHIVADDVQRHVSIPLLNIIDCVGRYIQGEHFRKVGLLGTRITMENDFYRDRLFTQFGIGACIPDKANRVKLHQVIYNELCYGKFNAVTKKFIKMLCYKLQEQGCEAIILGCTELPLILQENDIDMPLILTTHIHASDASDIGLGMLAYPSEVAA